MKSRRARALFKRGRVTSQLAAGAIVFLEEVLLRLVKDVVTLLLLLFCCGDISPSRRSKSVCVTSVLMQVRADGLTSSVRAELGACLTCACSTFLTRGLTSSLPDLFVERILECIAGFFWLVTSFGAEFFRVGARKTDAMTSTTV